MNKKSALLLALSVMICITMAHESIIDGQSNPFEAPCDDYPGNCTWTPIPVHINNVFVGSYGLPGGAAYVMDEYGHLYSCDYEVDWCKAIQATAVAAQVAGKKVGIYYALTAQGDPAAEHSHRIQRITTAR